MRNDEEPKPLRGEIYLPEERARPQLPEVPVLPPQTIPTALWAEVRYWSANRALTAFAKAWEAAERAHQAIGAAAAAERERNRQLAELDDLPNILAMDQARRDAERADAEIDRLKKQKALADYTAYFAAGGSDPEVGRLRAEAEQHTSTIQTERDKRKSPQQKGEELLARARETLHFFTALEKQMDEEFEKIDRKGELSAEQKKRAKENVKEFYNRVFEEWEARR